MTPSIEALFLAGAKVPNSNSRASHRLPALMLMWHSKLAGATYFNCCRIFTKKMARWLQPFVIEVTRSGAQERIVRGAWRTSWSHEETKEILQFSIISKYKKRTLSLRIFTEKRPFYSAVVIHAQYCTARCWNSGRFTRNFFRVLKRSLHFRLLATLAQKRRRRSIR